MDSNLKHWIAASLFGGHKPEELKEILVKSGFTPKDIEKELKASAPYIDVITKAITRLSLREALLKTIDQQMRGRQNYLTIEKVNLPPFKQFLEEYFYSNRPGFFTSVLDNSEARHWTPRNLLDKLGGDTLIKVQEGRDQIPHYEQSTDELSVLMKYSDYLEIIEDPKGGNNYYMAGGSYFYNRDPFRILRKELGNIGDGYFTSDDSDNNKMDFLIGPKGTVTSMHYDNANVFFIQVYGRKRIHLIPSMQAPYMYNEHYRRFSDVDILHPHLGQYPEFANATIIELEVGPGDAVFFPVGWWHQVTALTPCISASCANLNAGQTFRVFLP